MLQHTNNIEAEEQLRLFPATRYMGSKSKLLPYIWEVSSKFQFDSVIDLFSGSGVVSYMYKSYGKQVISNDYMKMDCIMAKALVENNEEVLSSSEVEWLTNNEVNDDFVSRTFKGLYFSDEDNHFIDRVRTNLKSIDNEYKQAIAMEALIRTCMKKRPRGIFTYVGDRYNDGRKDLQKSFADHYSEAVSLINKAVFDNGKQNKAFNQNSMDFGEHADLVYIDPPYYTPKSDNEYVRRYHFVEGLARDWKGVEIQEDTKTKKFKSYPTPFSTKDGAANAFDRLFSKFQDSILVVSYSSNSLPAQDDMIRMMKKYKKNVSVVPIDYKYSFGTRQTVKRNEVKEFLFVGC